MKSTRLFHKIAAGLFFIALSFGAIAQQPKLRIYIQATTSDTAGQNFLYNVRDQLGRSSRYELAALESDAIFQLRIVTLNPYGQAQSDSTVYGAVLTATQMTPPYATLFLNNWVGICTTLTTQSCAARLVGSMDSDVTGVYEALVSSMKNTRKQ